MAVVKRSCESAFGWKMNERWAANRSKHCRPKCMKHVEANLEQGVLVRIHKIHELLMGYIQCQLISSGLA